MPAISELTRQKPTQITIDIGDGDKIAVVFDRNRITPNWIEKQSEKESIQSASLMLADVILSWDVTQEDGSEYPPTAENIGVLSVPAQAALMDQVLSGAMPSDAEGKASRPRQSMPPTASTEPALTSPNGQTTSPSPSVSASPSLT